MKFSLLPYGSLSNLGLIAKVGAIKTGKVK